jgi:hypothetical protein
MRVQVRQLNSTQQPVVHCHQGHVLQCMWICSAAIRRKHSAVKDAAVLQYSAVQQHTACEVPSGCCYCSALNCAVVIPAG